MIDDLNAALESQGAANKVQNNNNYNNYVLNDLPVCNIIQKTVHLPLLQVC